MKIEIEVSDECEGTESPWWMIVDPSQNLRTDESGAAYVAEMITGPFFSRAEAQRELSARRYAYGKGAIVWCASRYRTEQYEDACRAEARRKREGRQ